MLINNLMNFQEIHDAFDDIAGDINILWDATETALNEENDLRDEGKGRLSNEDFERLEEIFQILESLTAYV